MDDPDDGESLADRLDRLEATLDELRATVAADDRVDADGLATRRADRATAAAHRLTERVAIPAAVAALEANVRLLEYLQDRLRAYEGGERGGGGPREVGERALDRVDDVLAELEAAIADADLPRDAEARRLFRRARDLNDELRTMAADRDGDGGDDGPTVIEIDVEAELDAIRDEVADEDDEAED